MRNLAALRALAVVAATATLLLQAMPVMPATAAPSAPDAWATACSASALGLDKDTVSHPPVLTGDKAPNGGPVRSVAGPNGAWYPVVFVHGWTSQSTVARPTDRSGTFSHRIDLSHIPGTTASTSRSLLGQIEDLPGAAVFTFDYHPYSARWVDDDHLGPALGKTIDCLYKQSHQKVIVVGHSMGGLIARWAATHPGVAGGQDRASEISTVVTFGTPELGSLAAELTANAVDLGWAQNQRLAALRLILSACGALTSVEIRTGTVCDVLPAPVRTFASNAGVALRAGSSQLKALKRWPAGIFVEALAGETTFDVQKFGWFAWPWDTDRVSGAGDMIVTKASAVDGADNARSIGCPYQLSAVRGATDQIGLLIGQAAKSEVSQAPLGSFSGACFHTSLMRSIELTNEALGVINDDLASRSAPTFAELASAPTPACGAHAGGHLTNGIQRGIPKNHGNTSLAWVGASTQERNSLTAFGDFNRDGRPDAATVLNCDGGGVGLPQVLVVYTHADGGGLRLIAHSFLSDFNARGHQPGENASASQVHSDGSNIHLEFSTQNDGDAAADSGLDYVATIALQGTALLAQTINPYTEVATAQQFVEAVRRHDAEAASRLASSQDVAADGETFVGSAGDAASEPITCKGLLDVFLDGPMTLEPYVDAGNVLEVNQSTERLCYQTIAADQYFAYGMSHIGFRDWRVLWVRQIGGYEAKPRSTDGPGRDGLIVAVVG